MCLIKITHCLLNITEPSFFYHSFKRKKNWNSVGNVCAQTSQRLIPLLWWFINIPLNRSLPATILELWTFLSFIHSIQELEVHNIYWPFPMAIGKVWDEAVKRIPQNHWSPGFSCSEDDSTETLKSRVWLQLLKSIDEGLAIFSQIMMVLDLEGNQEVAVFQFTCCLWTSQW